MLDKDETSEAEIGDYAQNVYNAVVNALEHSSDNPLIYGVTGNSLTEAGARDYVKMAYKNSNGKMSEEEYKKIIEWLS